MANTLESIMRLTDEYTLTMSKIIRSADEGYKANQRAEKGVTSLGDSLRKIAPSASTAQIGMSGLIGKLTSLVSTAYLARKAFGLLWDSIQTGAKQQVQRTTFQSLMKNQQLGNDLYDFVTAYAKKSALDRESLSSATTSFLAFTHDANQLQQLLNLTQRLYMFNPEQGAEGAVFALKEVLTGQTMSLKNRFNMNGVSAKQIQAFAEKGDISGTISYLDRVFNQFGATQGVVESNFKSLTVQMQLFKSNLMSALGDESSTAVQTLSGTFQRLNADMDAGKFEPFFILMANGTDLLARGIAWVAENANALAPIVAGAVTALVGYNIAMGAASLANVIFGATAAAATGRVLTLIAAVGAIGVGVAVAKNTLGGVADKSNKQAQGLASAAAKFSKDQKSLGFSPKVPNTVAAVPTTVKNKSPIKVSGTVEIEKENQKYLFDLAAQKMINVFKMQQVVPQVTIQNQNVSKEVDVEEVNQKLGEVVYQNQQTQAARVY